MKDQGDSAYYKSGATQVAQSILFDVRSRPFLPESNLVKCRIVGRPCGQFYSSAPHYLSTTVGDIPKVDQSFPYYVVVPPFGFLSRFSQS
jgi:hypothetical protein